MKYIGIIQTPMGSNVYRKINAVITFDPEGVVWFLFWIFSINITSLQDEQPIKN